MATATKETVEETSEESTANVELPDYTDEQLAEVKLTKVQENTIADLRKVMKGPAVDALVRDFKKANLYKQEHGERKAREASTEFTKNAALVYAAIVLQNKPLGEVATQYQVEVGTIPNLLREIRAKLFLILHNEGQISKDIQSELLKKHATAQPRKKRDKKVSADGANDDDSADDDDSNDDDADDDAESVEPSFTEEELAALDAED